MYKNLKQIVTSKKLLFVVKCSQGHIKGGLGALHAAIATDLRGNTMTKEQHGTHAIAPLLLCCTWRIGTRQHLAAGVLVVSLGCSGGAQRACGDHLHPIQLN